MFVDEVLEAVEAEESLKPGKRLKSDECTCICHTNPYVKYCRACCRLCPKCGGHIKDYSYEAHVKNCKIFRLIK